MAMRLESTSGGPMGSGFLPVHEGSQPPVPAQVTRHAHLPERYGIPLFELLVVDPYFIFISWEITAEQLELARDEYGESYENRRLQVLLTDAEDGSQIAARELYGDIGRWFIQLNAPGRRLKAEIQLYLEGKTLQLNSAGPVFVPRDTPIEPERWEELFVTYARGEKGELRIEAIAREEPAWPPITLARPPALTQAQAVTGSAGHPGSAGASRRIDKELLRPLLPVAPASVEDDDD